MTACEIIDELGRDTLERELGIKKGAVSAAYVKGELPAKWFGVVSDLLAERGKSAPRDAFSFQDRVDATGEAA